MPGGELEKMRIIAYNDPDLDDSHKVGQPFDAIRSTIKSSLPKDKVRAAVAGSNALP